MPALQETAHNLWLRGKKMAVNKIPESQLPLRSVSESDSVRVVGADGKSYRVPKTDFNGGGGGGLTADVKVALLDCFAHVAWIDEDGQDYYDALEEALYPPANLVSISAEFNSGANTIYDTASLNDLKQEDTIITSMLSS